MASPDSPADLRRALAGVRALLLDLDGVIVLKGELLPGAGEALARLEKRRIPYRIVTNTSLISRASLSALEPAARLADPARADHERAVGERGLHRPSPRRVGRSSSWPRPTP